MWFSLKLSAEMFDCNLFNIFIGLEFHNLALQVFDFSLDLSLDFRAGQISEGHDV